MNQNEFNNKDNSTINKYYSSCKETVSNTKDFISQHPVISGSVLAGSVLTTHPILRKATLPMLKYLGKQQIRLWAGLGVLSVASYISSNQMTQPNQINENQNMLS